ncbi:methyl-accepting chemotaxis protein [Pseudoteredinibacter isoporae]|uniref:methyl-accepting chemotaxis protein n=1 Tax=Pseudoteredinibacter isoporae TaxID=570281 RepID=UPI0031092012
MKNIDIKTMVLGVISASILLLLMASLFSTYKLRDDLIKFSSLLSHEVAAIHSTDRVNIEFKRQVQEWKNVLIRGEDDAQREKYWGKFLAQEESVQKIAKELKGQLNFDPSLQKQVQEFIVAHEKMGSAYRTGFEEFNASAYDYRVGDVAVKGIDRAPSKLLDDISKKVNSVAKQSGDATVAESEAVVIYAVILTLVTGALVLFGSYVILQREVLNPLRNTASAISDLSKGNLGMDVNRHGRGEIGLLNSATADLAGQMKDLIASLTKTSGALQHTAEMFEDQSSRQSQASTEQVAQSSQAAQEVSTLVSSAEHAFDTASHTKEMTEATMQKAEKASAVVDHVDELMKALQEDILHADNAVSTLSERVVRVDEVMTVIQGIAEQTNLLALNAAIEAARAGDQGRGFAVVADEVRGLAQKTQHSTQEIASILEDLRKGSESSVQAMKVGQEKTNYAAEKTNEIAALWQGLSGDISDISAKNAELNQSASRQSEAASGVESFIEKLKQDAVLQSQLSEEQRSASGELLELSGEIRTKIAYYQTS